VLSEGDSFLENELVEDKGENGSEEGKTGVKPDPFEGTSEGVLILDRSNKHEGECNCGV